MGLYERTILQSEEVFECLALGSANKAVTATN